MLKILEYLTNNSKTDQIFRNFFEFFEIFLKTFRDFSLNFCVRMVNEEWNFKKKSMMKIKIGIQN